MRFQFALLALISALMMRLSDSNSLTKLYELAIISQSNNSSSVCGKIQSTNSLYLNLCREKPEVITLIALATSAALEECNRQMKFHKWNCEFSRKLFNLIVQRYSKEAAYLNAITTAGVAYYVTKACSRGDLKFCQCSSNEQDTTVHSNNVPMTDCKENVDYGKSFSEIFIDGPSKNSFQDISNSKEIPKLKKKKFYRSAFKSYLELYNNNVARNVLIKSMETKCQCQGPSGSCTSKYCYKKLPDFSKIGAALKEGYLQAVKMPRFLKKRIRKHSLTVEDVNIFSGDSHIKSDQLMYLGEKFDYCRPNVKLGIEGVHGRECQNITSGPTSCHNLCCDYGFIKIEKLMNEQCNCKFKWCCNVECETCKKFVTKFYCNVRKTSARFRKYYLNN